MLLPLKNKWKLENDKKGWGKTTQMRKRRRMFKMALSVRLHGFCTSLFHV